MRYFSTAFFIVVSLALSSQLLAIELKGKVAAVEGNTVKISVDGDSVPIAGDKAEIVVEIPGLDDVALVAAGSVASVGGDAIQLSISRAPGKIVVGQLVRITSANPGKRAKSVPQPANPPATKPEVPVPKLGTGPVILHGLDLPIYAVAISPDARRFMAASSGGQVFVWDSTGKTIAQFRIDSEVFNAAAFSPDARFVLFGNTEGGVSIRDAISSKEVLRCTGDSGIYSVAFSPDGRRILSGAGEYSAKIDENTVGKRGRDEFTAVIWDAQTGREIKRFPGTRFRVSALACSADGRRIAAGYKDGTVRAWDLASGKKIFDFIEPVGAAIARVDFSSNGRQILFAGGEPADGGTAVNDQEWQERERAVSRANECLADPETPPEKEFAAVQDRMIRVFDLGSGKKVRSFHGHSSPIGDAAFSPDGKRILSGGWDQTVRIWDVATGTQLASLTGSANQIWRVAFSHDGKLAITGDMAGEVRIWQLPP